MISQQLLPIDFSQFLHYVLNGIAIFPIQCVIVAVGLLIWIQINHRIRTGIEWRQSPVIVTNFERPDSLTTAVTLGVLALPPSGIGAFRAETKQITKDDAEDAQAAAAAAITAIRDTDLEIGLIEQTQSVLTGQDLALLQRQLNKARRLIAAAFAAHDEIMDNPLFDPVRYTGYEYITESWLHIETKAKRARAALDFALGLAERIDLT